MAFASRPPSAFGPELATRTLARPALDPAHARMLALARPVMENLHQQLASATLAVILADRDGVLLAMVAPRGGALDPGARDAGAAGPALALPALSAPGALPARLPGGDAAAGARTVAFAGGARALMGLSSPILAAGGGMLGIIDLCASPLDSLSHAGALLRTTAAIIEHRLIEHDERGYLMLHFHPQASVLGTPLEALVLFGSDSRLLAANRSAVTLLAIAHACEGLRCPDCFAEHWSGLVDEACGQAGAAFTIHSCSGTPFFARARLCAAAEALRRAP